MMKGYEPKYGAKYQPGENVRQGKYHKHMAPLGIHKSGEDVNHVAPPFSKNVFEIHIAAAIFVEQAPSCSSLLSYGVLWGIAWIFRIHIYNPVATSVIAHSFSVL